MATQALELSNATATAAGRAAKLCRHQKADLAAPERFIQRERHIHGQALGAFGFRAVERAEVAPNPVKEFVE